MKTLLLAGICLFAALAAFASDGEINFDVATALPKDGATIGNSQRVPLGNTSYDADLLVSHYKADPDRKPVFVTISVEKKEPYGLLVVFERQFRDYEVPPYVLTAKTKEVMLYDENTRTVTFYIGSKKFSYILPEDRVEK